MMGLERILIVEDEDHKVRDLRARLDHFIDAAASISVAQSVRAAVISLSNRAFDLVILDMALPTYTKEKETGETGGAAQASGGVEVLRMMRQSKSAARIIIVTQYPDIFISGSLIRFRKMQETLRKQYEADVVGVVLYSYEEKDWEVVFDRLMETLL